MDAWLRWIFGPRLIAALPPADRAQAFLLVSACASSAAVLTFFAVRRGLLLERPGQGILLGAAATVSALVPLALRITGSLRIASSVLAANAYAFLFIFGLMLGGFYPAVHAWNMAIPLGVALFRKDARNALYWCAAACFQIGFLFWFQRSSYGAGEVEKIQDAGELISVLFLLMVGTWIGVTYRRARDQAEHALGESEERLRAIVDNSLDIVAVLDAKGALSFVSPSVERVLGYSSEEIRAYRRDHWVHPDDVSQGMEAVQQLLRGAPRVAVEVRCRHHDGSWRTMSVVGTNLVDRPGIGGLLMTASDVTEARVAEAAVRATEEHRQRAQQLESVGVLAGGIAHDFKNLLTVILGNISLARGEPTAAEPLLRSAEQACAQSTQLADQLLAFAKGGSPIRQAGSLSLVVRQAIELGAAGANIRCRLDELEQLWPVAMDAGQISQVLRNLLVNAVQAMPEGGTVEVCTRNVDIAGHPILAAGRYVLVEVEDHGGGIPDAVLPRIFDPYFSTKGSGSGLGLAIAHFVVKAHRGHIEVRTRLGVGSTFGVYLPASDQPPPATSSSARSEGRRSGRVLIMDDEKAVRTVLARVLARLGFEVVATGDGAEAIAAFEVERAAGLRFVAAILDLTVRGGMGGVETAQRLHSLDASLPLLVSSGYSSSNALAEHKLHGFVGVIPKPYTVSQVGEALDAVIES